MIDTLCHYPSIADSHVSSLRLEMEFELDQFETWYMEARDDS